MNAQAVLTELKRLGKPKTIEIYTRHGVTGPCYGVNYGDLKRLVKRIGRNQEVAAALWKSGVHDARVVATMIAEPEKMTRAEVEGWLAECANYPITDAVAGVAAKMSGAVEMARSWVETDSEWTTAAGWNVVAASGAKGMLSRDDVEGMLAKIQQGIHSQPNRTRHAMNNVLINIGGYQEALRPRVLAVVKAIGTVHVDHGETGCVTPDASAYIAKMVSRQRAKGGGSANKASTTTKATASRATARKTKTKTKKKTSTKRRTTRSGR